MTAARPVEVEHVTKLFPGAVRALHDVSFAIAPGERACLLGPNGAGKTTLIRLLSGALQATSGAVHLYGETSRSPRFLEAKRRVGIVPQQPGMYRELTAREYLELVRAIYRRGALEQVVEAFGLGEYLGRSMAALSGGTQRRLSLAAALLSDPELLLLDEPTAGMDPLVTREVHGYLREAMKARTVLLCTHNLDEAEALCDSAVILRAGQVLVHERIDALRGRHHPLLLLRATNLPALKDALARRGLDAQPGERPDELRIQLSDPERAAPELLRGLLAEGVQLFECRVLQPSLEELFLEVQRGA